MNMTMRTTVMLAVIGAIGVTAPPAPAQPDGAVAQAAQQDADPMEAIFGVVFEELQDAGLVAPEGAGEHLNAVMRALSTPDGAPDQALAEFNAFAQANGGEAWSWYGFAAVMRSGRLFETGDWQVGVPIWMQGKAALESGVEVANGAPGARLARGWTYAMVAKHEPNPANSNAMRATAAADLSAVAEHMQQRGASDALAAVLAAMASVEQERGNAESLERHFAEARKAVRSDRVRRLISRMLGKGS